MSETSETLRLSFSQLRAPFLRLLIAQTPASGEPPSGLEEDREGVTA